MKMGIRRSIVIRIVASVLIVFAGMVAADIAAASSAWLPHLSDQERTFAETIVVDDAPDEIPVSAPHRVIVQVIENRFFQWAEYELVQNDRSTLVVYLQEPDRIPLSRHQAQCLLTASMRWTATPQSSAEYIRLDAEDPQLNRRPRTPFRTTTPVDPFVDAGEEARMSMEESGRGLLSLAEDDRTRITQTESYPWNTICYVAMDFSSGDYRGSGFLISPYCVLTAGHNVYDQETSSWASSLIMSAGQRQYTETGDVIRPYGNRVSKELYSNTRYVEDGEFEYDYGAALFNTPFSRISTFMPLVFDQLPEDIRLAGYPPEVRNETNSQGLWFGSGSVLGTEGDDDQIIHYDAFTSVGESGAPVWEIVQPSETPRVVAIHTFGATSYNGGTRLTAGNQAIITDWMKWAPFQPPSPPANVSATQGTYSDKVVITWGASTGATVYEIYRADSLEDTKAKIGSVYTASYEDRSATPGVHYYYYIRASNAYGAGDFSSPVTGYCGGNPPTAPVNVSASEGTFTDKIRITWDASANATSYTVYRAASVFGTRTTVATVSGTSCDDTSASAGVPYYYWIKAKNSYGSSGYSVFAKGLRASCNYAIAPTEKTFDAGGGTGTVNVTASDGCGWTATASVDWITIAPGGSGNGTVTYSVAPFSGDAVRTATLVVAGKSHTVTQAPPTNAWSTITSVLSAKAALKTQAGVIELKWQQIAVDITLSGAQAVSGYFYADPADFAYGSLYNPEVFVKIYIDPSGWCNMAFNHVTVDDVAIQSAHHGQGNPSQSGTISLNMRLLEHQYTGVVIDSGVSSVWTGLSAEKSNHSISSIASSDGGYTVVSDLWAKAVLSVPGNPLNLRWMPVGQDLTPAGDTVLSGYFYADPSEFAYGSAANPEVFVKIYCATSGWANMAFNHVTVDDVTIFSAYQYSGTSQQSSTIHLQQRLGEHSYTLPHQDPGCNTSRFPLLLSNLSFPSSVKENTVQSGSVTYEGDYARVATPVMAMQLRTATSTITTYTTNNVTVDACTLKFSVHIPDDCAGYQTLWFKLVDYLPYEDLPNGKDSYDDYGVSNEISVNSLISK